MRLAETTTTILLILLEEWFLTTSALYLGDGVQPPEFLHEPPSRLVFSNDTGSQISCSAHGSPQPTVQWMLKDGNLVSPVPGLRQTPGNGTLYFPPFLGQYYRADVHEAVYRCRASNLVGTVLSRDVYVRAVVRKEYDIRVEGKDVALGNTAFLKCHIPDHVKHFVSVTSWYRGEEVLMPEMSDISGRYIVTSGAGDLYIRSVKSDDKGKKFSCLVTNALNGERKHSESVYLSVKDITSNVAPRTNQKPVTEMWVDRGNSIHLPCNIQGNPLPVFTWYRVSDSGALYPVPLSQKIIPLQTLLVIKNADERESGRWVCKASNQFGDQRIEIRLTVNSYLTVHIQPQVQTINSGGTAIFNCTTSGASNDNVDWFHDGKLIKDDTIARDQNKIVFPTPECLIINNVGRRDRGIYQCLVSNKKFSAQAMAELKLGDTVPELIYTFIEQNVRPGQHISLKCSATGSPPPQFSWLLDGQPIVDVTSLHRYAIGQFVDMVGDVISHLNITLARTEDGGLYKCIATNSMGNIGHASRLNVYGAPYVRAIGPIKAVAGTDLIIHCPFSGYPIESIRWEKSHKDIITSTRYEVASIQQGGFLKINHVDSSHDSGIYTCIVRSRANEESRRDIQLTVNSPPVMEPFSFPKILEEGRHTQVTCAVSSGDMPVHFSWQKDGHPIPTSLHITEKKEEFYTLLELKDITSRHSGRYTCFATNSAAKVNYTSELLVRVAPRWSVEPKDTAVLQGSAILIHCEASGYPPPEITWFKGQAKGSKEFKPIPFRNNTFVVDFATEDDESYYMCQAANTIGVGIQKVFHIDVNEPARFDSVMKNVSSRRNDPVTLSCLAKGDEPINIVWTHNGARIDLNNYRLSIAEIKTNDGVNSQLSIIRSDRQDSGTYRCVAENPFGTSEHVIYLAVQERPDVPSNLEIIEMGSRSVKLSWRRPFDGNSPVLSYIVQYKPLKYAHSQPSVSNPESDWTSTYTVNVTLPTIIVSRNIEGDFREQATVAGLHPATTYLIRMLAINEIERSPYTEPIVLKTQEEAPIEAPHNVQVHAGKGELIVTWQVPPRESWNGELLGYTVNCTEEKQNINYISQNVTSTKTITVHGWASTKTTINNLRTYTRYSIAVRAINSYGPGPWSASMYGNTVEGIPEAPPQNVNCSALSSESIKIIWQEPQLQFHGGIIQGYKIVYRPLLNQFDFSSANEVKRTSNMETYLHALYKATNYSIRVVAYTVAGDGLSSSPVYCSTEDDVPEPPADIKAMALTADSILVSWLPPKHRNGIIMHYTVYTKEAGRKGQARSHMIRVDEMGNPVSYEARGLIENQMYEFWVSASTSKGEGEPTAVIAQATNTRAPARIASFSQTLRKSVGSSLLLKCLAVGNPTPRARWFTRDRPVTFSQFYEITGEGNLKIHNIEPSLSGNYTCSAKNLFGEDQIIYTVIAMKSPDPPQPIVQYASADSIRISWEVPNSGGAPILGYTVGHRLIAGNWERELLTPEHTAHTLNGLKCGTQYILKISAHNSVGDGPASAEINVWTKGKSPIEPERQDFLQSNSSCIELKLAAWSNGGCPITHFSVEHRPLGDIRWTVVSSDISNSDENRENLVFCDFLPSTWYQLKVAATSDAGRTTGQFNVDTTSITGERIPQPETFPSENELSHDTINHVEPSDWLPTAIVAFVIVIAIIFIVIIFHRRMALCGPIAEGYESRTIPSDLKEEHENRRNQQVYSASPVKTVDKGDDSEMYEISPYATFSVSGGRTNVGQSKTPTRGVTTSTLDYTVQFKTFGHPEGDNLNATAYPIMPSGGFGHIKGKSSWHKQRYYNTDDDSTLSKSMTIMAGNSQLQNPRSKSNEPRITNRSQSRGDHESESDTSGSPTNEFCNAPTYRVPIKASRDVFRPDSSTESNNDNSPVDRRTSTPRHITAEMRARSRQHHVKPKENQSFNLIRSGSNNSTDSEVNLVAGLQFRPPSGFTDSREFSEAECDRERALDLEVQRVMENNEAEKIEREELTSLLARYQEKKEKERLEYTIHV